ncbi:hypothetical protein Ddc_14670 [Ditylenchus destructor]|nr:hypothetical protein Ddc_14670 [Ditylenchus destructor]
MKTLGEDRRFICFCGNYHVERGVNIMAKVCLFFIVLGLCIAAVVLIVWADSFEFKMTLSDSGAVIMLVFSIVAYVAILWAQKVRKPSFYWIFIAFEIFNTVVGVALLLAVLMFHYHPGAFFMNLSQFNNLVEKMEKGNSASTSGLFTRMVQFIYNPTEFIVPRNRASRTEIFLRNTETERRLAWVTDEICAYCRLSTTDGFLEPGQEITLIFTRNPEAVGTWWIGFKVKVCQQTDTNIEEVFSTFNELDDENNMQFDIEFESNEA